MSAMHFDACCTVNHWAALSAALPWTGTFLQNVKALPINITIQKLFTYAAGTAAQSCTATAQALGTSRLECCNPMRGYQVTCK